MNIMGGAYCGAMKYILYDAICSYNDGLSISKAHLGTQLIIIPLEALELRAGWLDIGGYDHIL